MAISAVSSLSSLSQGTSANSSANQTKALNLNFATYLKILIAQLQNQDPTNATDPNQFTQELIQMQQVQAQISNNEALERLQKATTSNGLASGVGYIGNYVRAASANGDFALQGGAAEIGYTLEGAASDCKIVVKNASGSIVATLEGGKASGDNYVSWDGKNAGGEVLGDGAYTFTVVAVSGGGNAITSSNPTALFKVTGVQSNTDGTLTLSAGNLSLLSTDVTGVYSASTLPASTKGMAVASS